MIPRTVDDVPIEFGKPYYWLDDEEDSWSPPVMEAFVTAMYEGKSFEDYKGDCTIGLRVMLGQNRCLYPECGNLEVYGSKAAAQAVANARRAHNESATDAMYEDALRDSADSGEKGEG